MLRCWTVDTKVDELMKLMRDAVNGPMKIEQAATVHSERNNFL